MAMELDAELDFADLRKPDQCCKSEALRIIACESWFTCGVNAWTRACVRVQSLHAGALEADSCLGGLEA